MQNIKIKQLFINSLFYIKNHILFFLFFIFFILYFAIGLYICFYNDILITSVDIFFDMDTCFAYLIPKQNISLFENFYKHPLVYIVLRPFFLLFNAFLNSPRAGTLFMQAVFGSSTVCLIYSLINNLIKRKNISFFLSLIYGLSLSTVVFSSVYEFYIYSAFLNTLMFYYVYILWNNNVSLKIIDYFILALLLIFSSGIITVTCIANIILVLSLFIKKKQKIKNSVYWFLGVIILYTLNILLVKFGYSKFFLDTSVTSPDGSPSYIFFHYDLNQLIMMIKGVFVQSFYGLNTEIGFVHDFYKTEGLLFADKQPFVLYIPSLLFFSAIIWGFIKNINKVKSSIALPLILIVIINIIECYFYNTKYCFLFSQNFLPYLIILTGIFYSRFSDKFINIFCSFFIVWECIRNFFTLSDMYEYAVLKTNEMQERTNFLSYNIFKCFIYAVISALLLAVLIFIVKNLFKNKRNLLPEDNIRLYTGLSYIYMIIIAVFTLMFQGII